MKVENIFSKAKQFASGKTSDPSTRGKVMLGCLFLGTFALALTNPTREAYVEHTSSHLSKEVRNNCGRIGSDVDVQIFILRVPAEVACNFFLSKADILIEPTSKTLVNWNTDSPTNYVLFSIYTTQLPGGKPFRTIGIGRRFIPLPS